MPLLVLHLENILKSNLLCLLTVSVFSLDFITFSVVFFYENLRGHYFFVNMFLCWLLFASGALAVESRTGASNDRLQAFENSVQILWAPLDIHIYIESLYMNYNT